MFRKTILALMIFVFLGGFILVKNSTARPRTDFMASAWSDDCRRVLPGSGNSENTDSSTIQDDSQASTGVSEQTNHLRPEIKGVIEKSSHFLFLRIKHIIN